LASAVPQAGTTRIYLPAPPLAQASSAADRQPLRLLSIRQQEQLRKEARAEAIRKVRTGGIGDVYLVAPGSTVIISRVT
jgi:hypothetical protein